MTAKAITLGFVGDIGLGPAVESVIGAKNAKNVLRPIAAHLQDCDIVVGNLECTIYDGPNSDSLIPGLCASPDSLDILTQSPITTLNLANNHVLDLGDAELPTMLERLRARGFNVFGAGQDVGAAETAHYHPIGDRVIAFLGACDVTSHFATGRRPGVAPMNRRRLCRSVKEAHKNADIVVVSLHADVEFVRFPSPYRRRLARALIDAGASVVVQHHPHVCQGIEAYGGGLIAYSLGNFIFKVTGNEYQENVPGVREGMILKIQVPADPASEPSFSIDPVRIGDDHLPCPLTPEDDRMWRDDIDRLSGAVAEPGRLRREWLRICVAEARRTMFETYYTARRRSPSIALGQVIRMIMSPEQRRWILGLFTFGIL